MSAPAIESPMRDGRSRFWPFAVATALALAGVGVLLWPGLPSIHHDEYLPLFPMTWFTKEEAAVSGELRPFTREMFGKVFPVLSYPYVGAVKAYAYLALGLPTMPGPYRMLQLVLLGIVFVVVLRACWRLAGRSHVAATVCLALLLGDVGLITLGVLDEGNQVLNLLVGTMLLLALYGVVEAPRMWKALPIALIVLIGELDRVNFLWFVGAGLAGCVAATLAGPFWRSVGVMTVATSGCALGLWGTTRFLPQYVSGVWRGMQESIPAFDYRALWLHAHMLINQLDPFSAYHRYVDTAAPVHGSLYAAYRWVWIVLYVAIVVVCAIWGLWARRRREFARPFLFLAAFMAALLLVIVKTKESWSAHHIFLVKPFAYVALGVLVARASRLRRPLAGLVALFVGGSAWAGAQAYREMVAMPPIYGMYEVSRNQLNAWQAAAASPVRAVYVLDWGVFYPGVLNSPPTQRWEAPPIKGPKGLRELEAARNGVDMALLFHTKGEARWLLESARARARLGIKHEQHFDRHPGEPWTLLVVNIPPGETEAPPTGGTAISSPTATSRTGRSDGAGRSGSVLRCDIEGRQQPCARLRGTLSSARGQLGRLDARSRRAPARGRSSS